MKRGDLFRVRRPGKGDPRRSRVYVVVSRESLFQTRFATVICAPIYTRYHGLSTQVEVGIEEGLKHESGINCDGLQSIPKGDLTDYIGRISEDRMRQLNEALKAALLD